jgi:hypothetical protein
VKTGAQRHRAEHDADVGEQSIGGGLRRRADRIADFRQSEIEDLHASAVTFTFAGCRSRCTLPRSCAASSASVNSAGLREAVNGGDIRMVQRGKRERLAPKPCEPIGVGGELVRQGFDRDVALERRVARGKPRPFRLRRAGLRSRKHRSVSRR